VEQCTAQNYHDQKRNASMVSSDQAGTAIPVVACTQLTKVYRSGTVALNELSLEIGQGTSFGLLGENGAGKSTLVRLIMGFILPTRGELRVLGERKVSLAHPRIGYLHERPYVELRFSGRSYLSYMAQLSHYWGEPNRRRVDEALELVGLSSARDKKLSGYSKGMLQRLCIAQALLTEPEFLILDEPTAGLDPYSQWEVRQVVRELRRRGKTLLICSRYLAEVEALCDSVGILQAGRLIQFGAVKELIQETDTVEILLRGEVSASEIATRLLSGEDVLETEQSLLRIRASAQQIVLAALVQAEVPIQALNPRSHTLEEVYIQATRPQVRETILCEGFARNLHD